MLTLYRFSDKELKELLSTLTIIIDTRENEVAHITDYFDKKNILYVTQKLDVGDYSCIIPADPDLGLMRDIYFPVAIERKNSLEELSGNLSNDRSRFESELLRGGDITLTLLVEDGSYEGIIEHNYRTQLGEKAFLASLLTFYHRYKIDIQFISSKYAELYIYHYFYYYVRELLY